MDYGLGFCNHGILQAGILEWAAIPFFRSPHLGIKPAVLMSPAFTGGVFTTSATSEAFFLLVSHNYFQWKNLTVVK